MKENVRKAWEVAGVVVVLAMLAVALCGCSHNAVSYGDGLMMETTINPESYAFGVSLRWGKILTVAVRENAEVEMKGGNEANAGNTTGDTGAKGESSVRVKIGRQITGYYVDAIEAGAKAKNLDEYTSEK